MDDGSLDKINVKEILQRVKSISNDNGKKGSFLSKSRRIFTIEKLGAPITKAFRGVVSSSGTAANGGNNSNNAGAKSNDSLSSSASSSLNQLDSIEDIASPLERRGRTMSTQDNTSTQPPVVTEKRPRALSFGFRKSKEKEKSGGGSSGSTTSSSSSSNNNSGSLGKADAAKARKNSISEETSPEGGSSSSSFSSKFGSDLFKLFGSKKSNK